MPKLIQNYSLFQQIGEGAYGKVYKAKHIITGEHFAVKVIPLQKFRENQKLRECFLNEKKTLTTIRTCPHIIKYVTEFRTENNYYFVYEYCNGGTLESLLKKEQRLSEPKALKIFQQLVEAFKVLNEYKIMHRDTKPENILFHDGVVKLADFGFCKGLDNHADMTATMLGSPIYMGPEVLRGEVYTRNADIWSLGVVLFQMFFGYCPFESNSIASLISTIRDSPLKLPLEVNNISQQSQYLIRKMLIKEPEHRMKWQEIFSICITDQGQYQQKEQHRSIRQQEQEKQKQKQKQKQKKQIKQDRQENLPEKLSPVKPNYSVTSSWDKDLNYRNFVASSVSSSFKPTVTAPSGSSFGNLPSVSLSLGKYPQSLKDSRSHGMSGSAMVSNLGTRRKTLIQDHQFCTRGIKTAIDIINVEDRSTLAYSYLILNKIQSSLKKIRDGISSSQTDLQDIFSTANSEIKQVQTHITQLYESLKNDNFDMKMLSDIKIYLSVKFRQYESDIRLWYDMVNTLLGDKTTMNSRDRPNHELVQFIRQKLR